MQLGQRPQRLVAGMASPVLGAAAEISGDVETSRSAGRTARKRARIPRMRRVALPSRRPSWRKGSCVPTPRTLEDGHPGPSGRGEDVARRRPVRREPAGPGSRARRMPAPPPAGTRPRRRASPDLVELSAREGGSRLGQLALLGAQGEVQTDSSPVLAVFRSATARARWAPDLGHRSHGRPQPSGLASGQA